MGQDTLMEFINKYGMVPAPFAAQNYRLGAVLVRNTREKSLVPIGDIESWAAEGHKEAAASVLRDIRAACAAWTTDDFIKSVQEEARSPTAGVITKTHNGDTVKLHFSYYGYESLKTHKKRSFAALVDWLAKLKGSSSTATQAKLREFRHHGLDRGWDPMSWKLNRQKVIPNEWTGDLDSRIYIITDVLLASEISLEQGSKEVLSTGFNPLAVAALAHGIPLATHTPEVKLEVSQAFKEGITRSGAPKLVAFRVIGADYDAVTGKLSHLGPIKDAKNHIRHANYTDAHPPLMQADAKHLVAMDDLQEFVGPQYLVAPRMGCSMPLMDPEDDKVKGCQMSTSVQSSGEATKAEAIGRPKVAIGKGKATKRKAEALATEA